jgi:hypothetical protein
MRTVAEAVDDVFSPAEVVELGGPYLDRRTTSARPLPAGWERSEEHTSELQSLS